MYLETRNEWPRSWGGVGDGWEPKKVYGSTGPDEVPYTYHSIGTTGQTFVSVHI